MKKLITCLVVCALSGAAFADTIHVPKQYPTIQVAINASMNGDEIHVAPGTYNESIDYNGRAISIIGTGGSTVTTIVGQGAEYPVRVDNVSAGECSLSGFTVTSVTGWGSYQVYCTYSTFTIDSCKLSSENEVSFGISFYSYCAGAVTNCDFEVKRTAVKCFQHNTITVTDSQFHSNTSDKVVDISSSNNTSSFTFCTFENNTGSRIIQSQGSSITTTLIDQCVFRNNLTSYETLYLYTNDTVSNCTFENNTSSSSGGSIIRNTPLLIDNCTFANNQSTVAAVYLNATNTTISNTTFCENTLTDVLGNWINGGGNEFLSDCGDVEGACCVDDSCYEVEQLFCDSVAGDWLGFNVICEVDTCSDPPQFGACCINGEAVALYDYDCYRIFGSFMGEGTDPADVTCPLVCAEDVNGDGLINVSDLLAIISVWGACQ